MPGPRILVVGAGSAGIRHARLLEDLGGRVGICDPLEGRAAAAGAGRAVPFDLERLGGFDAAVVASPSAVHEEQVEAVVAAGLPVLVEKPLASTAAGAARLAELGRGRVMVGYNLRLHPPVQQLVQLAHEGRAGAILSARLWFGSYLPDWRPGRDYRTTYSARSALGGGVLLDASHELDLLLWLLGDRLRVVGAVVERLGSLEIDVEDTVWALLRRSDGAVAEVSLDYLSRAYRRGMEVVGEEATLRLDWARAELEVEDAGGRQVEATEPVDGSYRRQAGRFLAWLEGDAQPPVDAHAGAAVVALAERIRAGAA